MFKSLNVEAEHNELILKNESGDVVIIPAHRRKWVQRKLEQGCHDCIDRYVATLPTDKDYAKNGIIVSELYKQKTGKDWSTAKQEGLTTGSYEDNIKLRQR